jgi:hypothetical protein
MRAKASASLVKSCFYFACACLSFTIVKIEAASTGNLAPVTTIIAPNPFVTLPVGKEFQLAARAVDPDGSVGTVQFLVNQLSIGFGTLQSGTNIWVRSWTPQTPGAYTIQVRATDNEGLATNSAPVSLKVAVVDPPSFEVHLIYPTEAAVLSNSITLGAEVKTNGSRIVRVNFYAEDNLLGSGRSVRLFDPAGLERYEYAWLKPAPGMHRLKAMATDGTGRVVTSDPVQISVAPSGPNQPPRFTLFEPKYSTLLFLGSNIVLKAQANDAEGSIQRIDFSVLDQFIGSGVLTANGTNFTAELSWKPTKEGYFPLNAKAVDSAGQTAFIETAANVVNLSNVISFRRELPLTYIPGNGFMVKIIKSNTVSAAYAAEDRVPAGWTVSQISSEGVFDPITRKVKFGFFRGTAIQIFSYYVTPPTNAVGVAEFIGNGSFDGITIPITGPATVAVRLRTHPADISPTDFRISINELTAYANAWEENQQPPVVPANLIPISYVTRAGLLWKKGEAYSFDPSLAEPLCWIPLPPQSDPPRQPLFSVDHAPHSVRTVTLNGSQIGVEIQVNPGVEASAYAVEEIIPSDLSVSFVNEGGILSAGGLIRWGPFFDTAPKQLNYTLEGSFLLAPLSGVFSVDGLVEPISGQSISDGERIAITLGHDANSLIIHLRGNLGTAAVVESAESIDSSTWSFVEEFPANVLEQTVHFDPASSKQQFYRLRLEP